jgi:hypothetical protein
MSNNPHPYRSHSRREWIWAAVFWAVVWGGVAAVLAWGF